METVRIIVCDDDIALQQILRQKIEALCNEHGTPCQVLCCDAGEELLCMVDKQAPDILFLDIQMPGRNGMEIAEELRKMCRETILIFVTALSEYVYDAFDVGAFHYLVKPFGDDKLRQVLWRALGQYEARQRIGKMPEHGAQTGEKERSILVKRGGISTRVRLSDIIYAEVFNRKVLLHTVNADIEYYGKLTDLSEQAGEDFYRTHRAYLVNLNYVERYNATTIWLERGTALVSKKQFAGFVRQYMRYINRKRADQ